MKGTFLLAGILSASLTSCFHLEPEVEPLPVPEIPVEEIPVEEPRTRPREDFSGLREGVKEWTSSPEKFFLGENSSGTLTWKTKDIRFGLGRNQNGGWEYFLLFLKGPGIDRIAVMNMGEGKDNRQIRMLPSNGQIVARGSKDLREEAEWRMEWGGGKIEFFCKGEKFAERSYSGSIREIYVGGAPYKGRNAASSHKDVVITYE